MTTISANEFHDAVDNNLPLPEGTTEIKAFRVTRLGDYRWPLPSTLQEIDNEGYFDLRGYRFPLPAGLRRVRELYLMDYVHPLPETLLEIDGLHLFHYAHRLPKNLKSIGDGGLFLNGYDFPLPDGITLINGPLLSLTNYTHPLPSGLRSFGGSNWVGGYAYPLPESLRYVTGDLDLELYDFPLPKGLKSITGDLTLRNYKHRLPSKLQIWGNLHVDRYRRPMSRGVYVHGDIWGAEKYKWPETLPPRLKDPVYDFHPPTSPAFKTWFADSVVVDEDGLPKVVFHGTHKGGFSAFSLSKTDKHHPGFYFADTLKNAKTYIIGAGNRVIDPTPPLGQPDATDIKGAYRVLLRLRTPAIIDCNGSHWNKINAPEYPGLHKTYQIATEAKRRGYDGVIFKDVIDSGGRTGGDVRGDVYVAFYPQQIKSALFNTGEYSLENHDIRRNPARTSRRSLRKPKTSRVKLPPGSKFGVPPPVIGGMPYAGKWTLVGSRRLGIPKETSDIDYMVRLEDVWHNISEFRPYEGVEGAYWKNFPRSKPKSGVVAIPGWAYDVLDKSMEQAVRRFSPAKMRKMRKELGKYKFYKTIGVAYTKPTLAPYAVPKRTSAGKRKTSRRARRTSRSST